MSDFAAVGCHIYAGGHTVGVRAAGFDAPLHLEEGPFGVETSKRNLGVEARVGQDRWHAGELRGLVDWLYGNPPCASWSNAGKSGYVKGNWRTDERTHCTLRLFDLLDEVEPLVFSWETVAAATTSARAFLLDRVAFCHARGYDVTGVVFDGKDLGLPSRRRRFFFVAHRVAFEPAPVPYVTRTVRDALASAGADARVRPDANALVLLRELAAHPPEKQVNLRTYFFRSRGHKPDERGRKKGCMPFAAARLGLDQVAPTATGSGTLYHPTEMRALTVSEFAAVCGYPPSYEFVGNVSSCYAQVAKAVLPPCGEWLARGVRTALERGEPVGDERRARLVNLVQPGDGHRYEESWEWMLSDDPGFDVGEGLVEASAPRDLTATEGRVVAPPRQKASAPRARAAEQLSLVVAPDGAPAPAPGQGSGQFIRQLLVRGGYSHEQILALVHRNFEGRKTSVSDVKWNLAKLKKEGAL